jgi:drug/metabolite transporter (DMT)-like permease
LSSHDAAAVGRSALLLLLATSCWGASTAVLAHVGGRFASGAALLAAGGALSLLGLSKARGKPVWAVFRQHWRYFSMLGVLEALNLGLYAGALHLGPLPAMVGLHLTSPILIVIWAALTRQRAVTGALLVELALVIAAVILVALGPSQHHSTVSVVAGAGLALGSAIALAVLISWVASTATAFDPDVAATLQLSIAALLTLPLVLVAPPTETRLWRLGLAGALLLAPGFALYWRALRRLGAEAAGIIGLNEAVVASLLGVVVFKSHFALVTLVAAGLVFAAVAIELGVDYVGGQRLTSG